MSDDIDPRPGAIRWTESGDIEMYDGQQWTPVRMLPSEDPVALRDRPEDPDAP